MNPRRSRTATAFLFCLILLAASPVTAPFSTFDLGDVTPGSLFQGTGVKAKGDDPHLLCLATPIESAAHPAVPERLAGLGRCAVHGLPQRVVVPLRI